MDKAPGARDESAGGLSVFDLDWHDFGSVPVLTVGIAECCFCRRVAPAGVGFAIAKVELGELLAYLVVCGWCRGR